MVDAPPPVMLAKQTIVCVEQYQLQAVYHIDKYMNGLPKATRPKERASDKGASRASAPQRTASIRAGNGSMNT